MRKSYKLAIFLSVYMLWHAGTIAAGIEYNLSSETLLYTLKFIIGFVICAYAGVRTFVSPQEYERRSKKFFASLNHRPQYNPFLGSLGASLVIGALAEGIYFRSLYAVLGGCLAAGMVAIAATTGKSIGYLVSVGRPNLIINRTIWAILIGTAGTVVCITKTLRMKPNVLEPLIKPILAIAGGHYGHIGALVAGCMMVGASFAFSSE
jgi:hypothetical protein